MTMTRSEKALNKYRTSPRGASFPGPGTIYEHGFDDGYKEAKLELQAKYGVDEACAIAVGFKAAEAKLGWQPIETAPKNGTIIDLWVGYKSNYLKGERKIDCCFELGQWFDQKGYNLEVTFAMIPLFWRVRTEKPTHKNTDETNGSVAK